MKLSNRCVKRAQNTFHTAVFYLHLFVPCMTAGPKTMTHLRLQDIAWVYICM